MSPPIDPFTTTACSEQRKDQAEADVSSSTGVPPPQGWDNTENPRTSCRLSAGDVKYNGRGRTGDEILSNMSIRSSKGGILVAPPPHPPRFFRHAVAVEPKRAKSRATLKGAAPPSVVPLAMGLRDFTTPPKTHAIAVSRRRAGGAGSVPTASNH